MDTVEETQVKQTQFDFNKSKIYHLKKITCALQNNFEFLDENAKQSIENGYKYTLYEKAGRQNYELF